MTSTVLITGGNSGIGKATATELARRGHRVVITARSAAAGEAAVADIRRAAGSDAVSWRMLDLASLASVRAFVDGFTAATDRLDVLINNAGIVQRHRTETADGFESTFGVNHLGHFALTIGLLDLLRASAPARIVVVASGAHKFAKAGMRFDDLQSVERFGSMEAYGRSKLANLLFARELSRRLDGTGVDVHAVHPGAVATRLGRDGDGGRLGEIAMTMLKPFFRSPETGARTSVWAATAPELVGVSGGYYADEAEAARTSHAEDDDAARELWEISESLIADR